jgi:hypothetical protein
MKESEEVDCNRMKESEELSDNRMKESEEVDDTRREVALYYYGGSNDSCVNLFFD